MSKSILSEYQKQYLEECNVKNAYSIFYYWGLKSIHEYETEDKPIYKMSESKYKETVLECLSYVSADTAKSYLTAISGYMSYIKSSGVGKIKFDLDKVRTEIRAALVDNEKINVFGREELYNFANNYQDKQKAMVVLLAFEGVKCTNPMEVGHIKKRDVNGTELQLLDRKLEVPEDMLPIIDRGYLEEKAGGHHKYYMNEYLVHNTHGKDFKSRDSLNLARNTLTKLVNELNDNRFGIAALEYSGILFYLSLIEQVKLSEPDEEDICKVLTRYCKSITIGEVNRISRKYKAYKESKWYKPNIDVSKFINVYDDIMSKKTIMDHDGNINGELGEEGESFIFDLLKKNYGVDNVKDQTKYKAGYDYLVNNNLEFEVKTTGTIGDKATFYMTIGEVRKALYHKERYIITIVSIIRGEVKRIYKIPDPMKELKLEDTLNTILETARGTACEATSFRFTAKIEDIYNFEVEDYTTI